MNIEEKLSVVESALASHDVLDSFRVDGSVSHVPKPTVIVSPVGSVGVDVAANCIDNTTDLNVEVGAFGGEEEVVKVS